MKAYRLALFVLLIAMRPTLAAEDYAPKEFIPKSVDEALQALPRMRSDSKDWDQFATMSSVTYHVRGHTVAEGDFEGRVSSVYFARDGDEPAHLEITLERADNGPSRNSREPIKPPEDLKPDAIQYIRTEDVVIGIKTYSAKVYKIDRSRDYDQGGLLLTRTWVWLVPHIPTGIAKIESFQMESTEYDKPSLNGSSRMIDLDVPIEVNGKKFTCYCKEHEELWPDGAHTVTREWKCAAVPGGLVRSSQQTTRGSVQEFTEMELTEFDAQRPVPPEIAERERKLREARGLFQMGDTVGSIAAFDSVLETGEKFPGRAGAYCDRGWAKWSSGDHPGGMADYNKAIEIDSHLADAYNNRGYAKFEQGDFKGALKDFNHAIDERPEFGRAIAGRALTYMRLHKDKQALEDYETVITKWPTLKDSLDREIEKARAARK